MSARALIIAAPRSGSGKTTITLALLAALSRRGLTVRAGKAGPDYIDLAFHALAAGAKGCNFDSWAMPDALLDALLAEAARGADVLVVEGVMGLFDGIPGSPGRRGSTADLAARFGIPVLLVIDVSGQTQSAAALVRGFASHDPAVHVAGVVLNRIASERHRKLIVDAIAHLDIPVVGVVARDEKLTLPQRHLGLVQATEHADLAARLDAMAQMAERCLDLDAIIAAGRAVTVAPRWPASPLRPPGQRVALACDAAFTFIYEHIVAGWRRAGAEIIAFSPLADAAPPESCDSCWLPGGYPELHAGPLAAATRFRAGLAAFAKTRPVHGECGGYMVLGEGIEDASGARHSMTGLLSHATSFAQRKLHLGYREARMLADGPLGPAGSCVRGHEFHYASLTEKGNDAPFSELADGQGYPLGPSGGRRGNVTGSFFHAMAQISPQ
jgi:cobyrinic acid a,c-diamide synthase